MYRSLVSLFKHQRSSVNYQLHRNTYWTSTKNEKLCLAPKQEQKTEFRLPIVKQMETKCRCNYFYMQLGKESKGLVTFCRRIYKVLELTRRLFLSTSLRGVLRNAVTSELVHHTYTKIAQIYRISVKYHSSS